MGNKLILQFGSTILWLFTWGLYAQKKWSLQGCLAREHEWSSYTPESEKSEAGNTRREEINSF